MFLLVRRTRGRPVIDKAVTFGIHYYVRPPEVSDGPFPKPGAADVSLHSLELLAGSVGLCSTNLSEHIFRAGQDGSIRYPHDPNHGAPRHRRRSRPRFQI